MSLGCEEGLEDPVLCRAAPDELLHRGHVLGVEPGAHLVLGSGPVFVQPVEHLHAQDPRTLGERGHGGGGGPAEQRAQQRGARLLVPGRDEVLVAAVVRLEDLEARLYRRLQPLAVVARQTLNVHLFNTTRIVR